MKRFLQISLGLAISAGALWLTLRGKNLSAIWAAAHGADYRWLLPYVGILAAIHVIRTLRWGILLEPVAKVPFSRLNAVSAVGFMALMILPFRIGEFARPYLIAERPRIRVSATLSSVVVERVADGIFTAALLVLSLLAVPGDSPGLQRLRVGGVVIFAAFVALLAFLVVAYRNRALAVRFTHRILDPLSPRFAGKAAGMMDAFIHGLRVVPSRAKVAWFFVLTGVYWGLNGWGMGLLARAFGMDLALVQSFAVLGALVVGVMIPAGPGMVGTFQAFTLLGLSFFVPKEVLDTHGTAYANVLWAVQLGFTTLLGLFFLFSRHIRIAQIFSAPAEVEEGLEQEERQYVAEGDGAPEDAPGR